MACSVWWIALIQSTRILGARWSPRTGWPTWWSGASREVQIGSAGFVSRAGVGGYLEQEILICFNNNKVYWFRCPFVSVHNHKTWPTIPTNTRDKRRWWYLPHFLSWASIKKNLDQPREDEPIVTYHTPTRLKRCLLLTPCWAWQIHNFWNRLISNMYFRICIFIFI